MKKKDCYVKATVIFEVQFHLDKETEPEDVFQHMWVDSRHGFIYDSKVIHTAITKKEKIK